MNSRRLGKLGACILAGVAGACAVVFALFAAPGEQGQSNMDTYLPEKAQIRWIRPGARESSGQTPTKQGVLERDLDGDGTSEQVVFYTLHRKDYGVDSAHVVVLREHAGGYQKLFEYGRRGAPYINPLSGVWDINADGRLEVVAVSWVGASFGGYLDIFQWDGDSFASLNGQWNDKNDIQAIKLEDLDQDGVVEVTILHRFSYPDTYKWGSSKYFLDTEGGAYPTYMQP
jgi:hypothetical protein